MNRCFNEGYALVIVVIIVAVSVIIGSILMSLTVQNSCMNYDVGIYITCYYMAYGQLLHTLDIMQTNVEIISIECCDAPDFMEQYRNIEVAPLDLGGDNCVTTVNVELLRESETVLEYEIETTASIDNVFRKLRAQVIITWSPEKIYDDMFKIESIKEV